MADNHCLRTVDEFHSLAGEPSGSGDEILGIPFLISVQRGVLISNLNTIPYL
jgi:hypothetical protein